MASYLKGWRVWQGDVEGAYLNATAPPGSFIEIDETMLHILPEEARDVWKQLKAEGARPLVRLLKSLYGHSLSGFLWELWFRELLVDQFGFENDPLYPCLFTKGDLCLLLYVDDFLVAGPAKAVRAFEARLKELVRLKDNELHVLGSQPMLGCKYVPTHITPGGLTEVRIDMSDYAAHAAEEFWKRATGGRAVL